MNPILINYVILVQFALLSIVWAYKRDYVQSLYWLGATFCNAAVTFK